MQNYIVLVILFLFIIYLLNNKFNEQFEEEESDRPKRNRKSLGGRKR